LFYYVLFSNSSKCPFIKIEPQTCIYKLISNMDIFPLISVSSIVSTNCLWYWKQICQCDVKHIMTSSIKTITSDLKVSTLIFTSITARHAGLAGILVIMSFSTFITDVILYISPNVYYDTIYIYGRYKIYI
jgi:hypothetical protein